MKTTTPDDLPADEPRTREGRLLAAYEARLAEARANVDPDVTVAERYDLDMAGRTAPDMARIDTVYESGGLLRSRDREVRRLRRELRSAVEVDEVEVEVEVETREATS